MSSTAQTHDGWEKLTNVAIAMAMGLVLARGMMLETVRETARVLPGQELILRMPAAAVTTVLDWLSFLPAILVALRAWRDERFVLRWSISSGMLGAIGVLAIASIFWTDDRFAAAVSSGKLLAGSTLAWALVQCVRDWRTLRVVVALVVGLFAMNLLRSIVYVNYDLPEMISMWEQGRDQILRDRAMEPGSFTAQQFERRINNGELLGFNASPNTLAAITAMSLVLLMGDLLQRVKDRRGWSWLLPAALMAGGAWIIWRTESMTAMATPLIGGGLLVIGWKLRGMLGRWRKTVFIAGVAFILCGWAAVIAYGIHHGSLLQKSLTFRWHYWRASFELFKDNLLLGVGWENFGPRYLQYRLPVAPEEVKDPHNLFVRFATELGVIGLALAIGWLLSLAWEATRPAKNELGETDTAGTPWGLWPIPLTAVIAFVVVVLASTDFSVDVMAGVYDAVWKAMYCFVMLAVAAMFAAADLKEARVSGERAPILAGGMAAGLAIFIVHNFIDFAIFETGAFYLFVASAAAMVGLRAAESDGPAISGFRGVVLVKLVLLWLAFGILVTLPVGLGEASARRGDQQVAERSFTAAQQSLEEAFTNSAWLRNGDYLVRKAAAQAYQGLPPQEMSRTLTRALDANPRIIAALTTLGELSARSANTAGMVYYYEKAIAFNPMDIDVRLDAAKLMAAVGLKQEARAQYLAALAVNEARPADEPERLSQQHVDAIRHQIDSLKDAR